jgi:putative transposase
MRDLVVLFIHFIASLARLLGPGGARSLVAESLLLKHQLLILNRSRQQAPNLSASDRILAGWLALWLRPTRLLRSAIVAEALDPDRPSPSHVQAKVPHAVLT